MFQKSKYDVMASENSMNTGSLLLLVGKIYRSFKSYEKGKIDKDYFNAGFVQAIGKGLPNIKAIAHIGYENSKDLENVSEESLYMYMENNGLSKDEFIRNYDHITSTYIKVIMAFSIIERENLNVYRIISPEVLLGIVKGEFKAVKEVIDNLDVNISDDSKSLMDKLVKDDFSIRDLNKNEKDILDKEHDEFMKKHINSRITKASTQDEVLKHAKSIGKKKSVLEI